MTQKAVALGNFDGIHKGHMSVLKKAVELRGDGFEPCALLFTHHSEKALKGFAPPMLMTEDERKNLILSQGLHIETVNFDDIRDLAPEEFVDKILIHTFKAGSVVCGYNYRFGKNACGNADTLKEICGQRNIKCFVADEIDLDGQAVSSTVIRTLIENGKITEANRMLGRKFGFASPVIHGDARGRSWGFPTANQKLPEGLVVPKFGVYASVVTIENKTFKGVTNIGKRPTVGTNETLSETNILDFNEDIYGRTVDVRLVKFIRPEQKFSSFRELAEQIKNDCEYARGCVL